LGGKVLLSNTIRVEIFHDRDESRTESSRVGMSVDTEGGAKLDPRDRSKCKFIAVIISLTA
jgi:hypothetical protein